MSQKKAYREQCESVRTEMEGSDALLARPLAAALPGTPQRGTRGPGYRNVGQYCNRLQSRGKRSPSKCSRDGVIRGGRRVCAHRVQLCPGMAATAMIQTVDRTPIANARGSA